LTTTSNLAPGSYRAGAGMLALGTAGVDAQTTRKERTPTRVRVTIRPPCRGTSDATPRSPFDRLPEDFDCRDIDPAAGSVAAAGEQIDEADLVDLAQIRLVDEVALRDHRVDVEAQPANIRQRDVALQPVRRRAVSVIADEPRAVRQLDDRSHLMEARHLRRPADASEPGEIGEVGLVAQR